MKKNSRRKIVQVKKCDKKMEHLQFDVEVKQLDDMSDGFFRFEGLASTFGNIDLVDDIVAKGAFAESLEEKDPIILWQHSMFEPIGMPEEVRETNKGLFIKVRLPKSDTLVSGRVIPQIEVGSIRKMSIGFRVQEFSIDENGIRTLLKIDLREVSLVTFPANPLADITAFKEDAIQPIDVKAAEEIKTKRDFENILRDSGLFTKKAACLMASYFQGEPDSKKQLSEDDLITEELKLLCDDLDSSETQKELNAMTDLLEI